MADGLAGGPDGYTKAMDEPDQESGEQPEDDDRSILDRMRDTGVGVDDPNIVGDPEPGIVEEQVADDEAPEV